MLMVVHTPALTITKMNTHLLCMTPAIRSGAKLLMLLVLLTILSCF
jgi:hypothetical protein